MIGKDEALQKFKDILTGMADWAILKGSQFMEHLSVFQSWALRSALWEVERAKQEFFASTALNRSSLLAHVEDREYLPRKAEPSSGTVTIKNNGAYAVSLPVHHPFISDLQVDYLAGQACEIAPGASVEVEFLQLKRHEIPFTVSEEKPFYEVLVDRDLTPKVNSIEVWLDAGEGPEEWAYSRLLQNSWPDSKVFDERYSHLDQIAICFGNGNFGMIPPLGATGKLVLWLTDGNTILLPGQPMHLVGELLDAARQQVNLSVLTATAITGGRDAESTAELKSNLHYWPIYNERLVWQEDYLYFIRRRYPDIVWIKVWGEQEAEAVYGARLSHINKIFVSAYSPYDPEVGAKVMDSLRSVPLLNRKFEWLDPIFSAFQLTVSGKVARSRIITDVVQDIRKKLTLNYGKDSRERLPEIYIKDFYRTVNETGHFGEREAYFEISHSGKTEATDLQEMIYLDLDNTVIELDYA